MQEEDATRQTELIMRIVIAFALVISPWFWGAISEQNQDNAKLALMQYCLAKTLVLSAPSADFTEKNQRIAKNIDCSSSVATLTGPNG